MSDGRRLNYFMPREHKVRGLPSWIPVATDKRPGGCCCSNCYSPTQVIDSRPGDGHVRRIRVCQNPACGKRFTTYETETNNPRARGIALLSISRQLRKLADKLARYAERLGESEEESDV